MDENDEIDQQMREMFGVQIMLPPDLMQTVYQAAEDEGLSPDEIITGRLNFAFAVQEVFQKLQNCQKATMLEQCLNISGTDDQTSLTLNLLPAILVSLKNSG